MVTFVHCFRVRAKRQKGRLSSPVQVDDIVSIAVRVILLAVVLGLIR